MKLEKLASGSYRVRKMYKGKTISLVFPYKPSQKEIAIALAEKMEDNTPASKGTFEEYAKKYIADRSNVLSPASVNTYTNMLNVISKEFKKKNLFDITQSDIQKEINDYALTCSPKTVRSRHGFISSVFSIFRPSMVIKTTLPQKIVKPSKMPTEENVKALLKHIKGTEDSVGIQLGILSLRRAEICALEMSDLNGNELTINKVKVFKKGGWVIKPCPKTDASNRKVYLPDALVKEIKAQGYFFKYSPQKLNQHLHEYQRELGLEEFVFHDLRHYFASYAHAIGIPDADIMQMGGWKSDYVMKSVYREAMEEKTKKSAEKLAASIF